MPTYEYKCNRCGHYLNASQKISETKLTDCPSCKESSLERQISRSFFNLKGSDWTPKFSK
jgi:putative FmdB family regulatory protein